MSESGIKREHLPDEPTREDAFKGGGHQRVARALADAIQSSKDCDRAIGLEGQWGSGKSSVVDMARDQLSDDAFLFFTYDVWKSHGQSFRKSFLDHFLKWADGQKVGDTNRIAEIKDASKGIIRNYKLLNRVKLDWFAVFALSAALFLPFFYSWGQSALFPTESGAERSWEPIWWLLGVLMITLVTAFVRVVSGGKLSPKKFKWNSWRGWQEVGELLVQELSSMILATTNQHENQRVTEHYHEIDPNEFEFQQTFRNVLGALQSSGRAVVITLDNIDRLPSNEIAEQWALMRSVFTTEQSYVTGTKENRCVTVIVPYDRKLIQEGVGNGGGAGLKAEGLKVTNWQPLDEKNEPDEKRNEPEEKTTAGLESPDSFDPDGKFFQNREVFSKIFDEILFVPAPIMSNVRGYFYEKLSAALPEFDDEEAKFNLYAIYSRLLKAHQASASPRQVISFINEVSSLFALHDGKIPLPTIGVYVAHRDAIEQAPESLSRPTFLDAKIRLIARDDELIANLAAIAFCVDQNMALEVLLDQQIADAATDSAPDRLKALSQANGFDERVGDVIEAYSDEWCGNHAFSEVIVNFAALLPEHRTASTSQTSKLLTGAFQRLSKLELENNSYVPYLRIFKIVPQEDLPSVVMNMITLVMNDVQQSKLFSIAEGASFAKFVNMVFEATKRTDATVIRNALSTVHCPPHLEFVVGLSAGLADSDVSLSNFRKIHINEPEEWGANFAEYALENPKSALVVYRELWRADMNIPWLNVASKLVEVVQSDNVYSPDQIEHFWPLLADVWAGLGDERAKVNVGACLQQDQAVRNLHQAYMKKTHGIAFAATIGLLGSALEGGNLPSEPTMVERAWLADYLAGKEMLSEAQIDEVVRMVCGAKLHDVWIEWGAIAPDNKLVSNVVRGCFEKSGLYYGNLSTVWLRRSYLKSTLGDQYDSYLARCAKNLDWAQIPDLENCPEGFLSETLQADAVAWKPFHELVDDYLNQIELQEWPIHLGTNSPQARLLREKIESSKFVHEDAMFKDVIENFVLNVLSSDVEISDPNVPLDVVLSAIDPNRHGDLYRSIYEKAHDVTSDSLSVAVQVFPKTMQQVINALNGQRLTEVQKDKIVRELLCPALDGNCKVILKTFMQLNKDRVPSFIKASSDTTKSLLTASLNRYKQGAGKTEFGKQVSKLVGEGARKKGLLNFLDPSGGEQ